MTDQNDAALQHAEDWCAAADRYFGANPSLDTMENRRIYSVGFDNAYTLLSKQRARVAADQAAKEGESLPVVARLYYGGSPSRRYRRASTQPGPGEPLCFVSDADAMLRRKDWRIAALEKELSDALASARVAKPLFWYRPCSDGLYEGPHRHNSGLGKMLRAEKPDQWKPLFDHAAPRASEAVGLRQAISTFGSKVFKALDAIARADGPDTRKEDDPELIYRERVMDEVVRIRQAYDEFSQQQEG